MTKPCYLTGIVQAITSSLLSASSTLHTLFLQLWAPAASLLQESQPIPTVLWLFSSLITCAFPSWVIDVSSGSSLLAVFTDSGLNSGVGVFFSPPLTSSEVAQLEALLYLICILFFIIYLICLFCVLLSPALFVWIGRSCKGSKTHWAEAASEMGDRQYCLTDSRFWKGKCRLNTKRRAVEYYPLPCEWNQRRWKWVWKTLAWAAL